MGSTPLLWNRSHLGLYNELMGNDDAPPSGDSPPILEVDEGPEESGVVPKVHGDGEAEQPPSSLSVPVEPVGRETDVEASVNKDELAQLLTGEPQHLRAPVESVGGETDAEAPPGPHGASVHNHSKDNFLTDEVGLPHADESNTAIPAHETQVEGNVQEEVDAETTTENNSTTTYEPPPDLSVIGSANSHGRTTGSSRENLNSSPESSSSKRQRKPVGTQPSRPSLLSRISKTIALFAALAGIIGLLVQVFPDWWSPKLVTSGTLEMTPADESWDGGTITMSILITQSVTNEGLRPTWVESAEIVSKAGRGTGEWKIGITERKVIGRGETAQIQLRVTGSENISGFDSQTTRLTIALKDRYGNPVYDPTGADAAQLTITLKSTPGPRKTIPSINFVIKIGCPRVPYPSLSYDASFSRFACNESISIAKETLGQLAKNPKLSEREGTHIIADAEFFEKADKHSSRMLKFNTEKAKGKLHAILGGTRFLLGDYPASAAHYHKAAELLPAQAELWLLRSGLASLIGGYPHSAASTYAEALPHASSDNNTIYIHQMLAWTYISAGNNEAASRELERAEDLALEAPTKRERCRASGLLTSQAILLAKQGKLNEALSKVEAALECEVENSLARSEILTLRGLVAGGLQDHELATNSHLEAISYLVARYGPTSPEVMEAKIDYSTSLGDLGLHDTAVETLLEIEQELMRQGLATGSIWVRVNRALAAEYVELQRLDLAIAKIEEAMSFESDNPCTSGNLLRLWAKLSHDEAVWERALPQLESCYGRTSAAMAEAKADHGAALTKAGHFSPAIAELETALSLAKHLDLPWLAARCHALLGQVLLVANRQEEAIEHLRLELLTLESISAAPQDLCKSNDRLGQALSDMGLQEEAQAHILAARTRVRRAALTQKKCVWP